MGGVYEGAAEIPQGQVVAVGDGHIRPEVGGDGGDEIAFLVVVGVKDIAAVEAVDLEVGGQGDAADFTAVPAPQQVVVARRVAVGGQEA